MTNTYHDQLDAYEARVRAEQEETEIAEADKKVICICLEYIGDNGYCPVHGYPPEVDGSDTIMKAQLNDAGYGCGGIY